MNDRVMIVQMATGCSPIIRVLAKDDWKSFAAIRLEALKQHPNVYASSHSKESEYSPEEWQRTLGTEDAKRVFGAIDDNRLIGICGVCGHDYEYPHTYHSLAARALMASLYVQPAYRGRGLATDLGRACLQWGIDYIPWQLLAVGHRDGNTAAQAVIRALGFTLTEIEHSRTWPDGTKSDLYWYIIDLAQYRAKKTVTCNRVSAPF